MQGYFVQFLAYTMAMVGFLAICLFVYKKLGLSSFNPKNSELSIENCLRINARKYIYIIKAGKERFLIAADSERTTMLAKLHEESGNINVPEIKESLKVENSLDLIEEKTKDISDKPLMIRISNKMKV